MSTQIDPTYLRYIYDGLSKGNISTDNEAALPEGLVGLYQEAFNESIPAHKRQKTLEYFAMWALLKKEVSSAFFAEMLNTNEDDVADFIASYAAWFNSPESGKYILYHERLRLYLLQKLSGKEVHVLHEGLITRLEQAIEDQKADEFERYGLEILSEHLLLEAMISGEGKNLINLAYSQAHWQRQLKISKGYTWTKNGLKAVMSWASKHNDDEVIECGLQMVDLHHQEQNAAPQILALVAEGDFEPALKRIDEFAGNDKEALQRKFILYMLCLMELTLLDSKDKPFRKDGIEKLLKHLDDNLPVDHSILNWNDFFSSYLMYKLICIWDKNNIDYILLFNYTDNFDSDWIMQCETFNNKELGVLKLLIKTINKGELYYRVLLQESKQSEQPILFSTQNLEINPFWYSSLLISNAEHLFSKGFFREAEIELKIAINTSKSFKNKKNIIHALKNIAKIYFDNGRRTYGLKLLNCVLEYINNIVDIETKDYELSEIIQNYLIVNEFEIAEEIVLKIETPAYKYYGHMFIANYSSNIDNVKKEQFILQAGDLINSIEDDFVKIEVQINLTLYIYKQKKINKAIEYIENISLMGRDEAKKAIAFEILKAKSIKNCLVFLKKHKLNFLSEGEIYSRISKIYALKGNINNCFKYNNLIIDEEEKIVNIKYLCNSFLHNEKANLVPFLLHCLISQKSDIDINQEEITLNFILKSVNNSVSDALFYSENFLDEYGKTLVNISIAIKYKNERNIIEFDNYLNKVLIGISKFESLLIKDSTYKKLISALIEIGLLEDAYSIISFICYKYTFKYDRFCLLLKISLSSIKKNENEKAQDLLKEAKSMQCQIDDEIDQLRANEKLIMYYAVCWQKKELLDVLNKSIESLVKLALESENSIRVANLYCIFINLLNNLNFEDEFHYLSANFILFLSKNKITDEEFEFLLDDLSNLSELLKSGIEMLDYINVVANALPSENIKNIFFTKIGENLGTNVGYEKANLISYSINEDSNLKSFKKGLFQSLGITNLDQKIIINSLKNKYLDINSLEHLLYKYALNQILNNNLSREKNQRYNQSLNIQWAIDIKSKFKV